MVEAENEERRIKSGMTSSKHLSGANKTFGMRKVDLLARQLWDKTADGGVLVIVEPGTPRGSKLVRRIQLVAPEFEYPCLGLQLFAVPQLNESFGVSRGRRKFQSDSADGHFGKIKERVDHFRVDSAHVHASAATKFLCKGPCHANGSGK